MTDALDSPTLRQAVNDVLQEHAMEVDGERSLLMGWCVVVEWVASDGNRWLSYLATDARCEPAPTWQSHGYLHNALNDWPSDEVDD